MKRRIPPLNAIRAFEAAARLQSFTEAADELSVTPTAVSHQIRHLENLLEIKLFQRNGRNIEVTPQGARILPDLSKGMDMLANAFEEVYGDIDKNTINVTTTREFARYWLQPRMNSFYSANPDLAINIFASEKCSDLESREIDVAIRYGDKPDEKSGEITLFQEFYVGTVNKRLVIKKTGEGFLDLEPRRLIDVRWEKSSLNAPTWKTWFNLQNLTNYSEYNRVKFDAYNLAFDALKRGHGAALLSKTIVSSAEFDGDLTEMEGPKLPGYYYRLILTKAGKRKLAVQKFMRWLIDQNAIEQAEK